MKCCVFTYSCRIEKRLLKYVKTRPKTPTEKKIEQKDVFTTTLYIYISSIIMCVCVQIWEPFSSHLF